MSAPRRVADGNSDAMVPSRILLTGDLDADLAGQVGIQLMAHDASSDSGVDLVIRSAAGTIQAALGVMDTIDAMGVPVAGIGLGQVEGPALGVLAVCHRRQAGPSSRLRLVAPSLTASGTAKDLVELVQMGTRDLERFTDRIARATGQPAERIEIDLRQGRYFDPDEAVAYHLIDRIWGK
ncbi:MAG: ATP-dependent Clp protease proteolytic subunit [Candidatus Dormibacteria bacterium]